MKKREQIAKKLKELILAEIAKDEVDKDVEVTYLGPTKNKDKGRYSIVMIMGKEEIDGDIQTSLNIKDFEPKKLKRPYPKFLQAIIDYSMSVGL